MGINDFPLEILVMILKFLPIRILMESCSRVCKLWDQLSTNPELYRVIRFRNQKIHINAILKIIVNGAITIDVSDSVILCEGVSETKLSEELPSANRLLSLSLVDTEINSSVLSRILCTCKSLEELRLCVENIDNELSDAIAKLSNLEKLFLRVHLAELTENNEITFVTIVKILRQLNKLQTFVFNFNNKIFSNDFCTNVIAALPVTMKHLGIITGKIQSFEIRNIVFRCPNLMTSTVNDPEDIDNFPSIFYTINNSSQNLLSLTLIIRESNVQEVKFKNQTLRALAVVSNSITSSSTVKSICLSYTSLEILNILYSEINEQDLNIILKLLPRSMKYLHLPYLMTSHIEVIISRCNNFTCLSVKDCAHLDLTVFTKSLTLRRLNIKNLSLNLRDLPKTSLNALNSLDSTTVQNLITDLKETDDNYIDLKSKLRLVEVCRKDELTLRVHPALLKMLVGRVCNCCQQYYYGKKL